MKRSVILSKIVRALRSFVTRENAILAPVAACDVDPSTLHVMPSQPNSRFAHSSSAPSAIPRSSRLNRRSNAASSPLCGVAVSMIRCRSRSLGKAFEQLESLLPTLMCADAGVRLVDHDQGRARARKTFATALGLDVVEAHDRERIGVEQRLRCRQTALQTRRGGGCDSDRIEIEFRLQVRRSIARRDAVGTAREPIRLATIDQFAQDQARPRSSCRCRHRRRSATARPEGAAPSVAAPAGRHAVRSQDAPPSEMARRHAEATAATLRIGVALRPGSQSRPRSAAAKRAGRTGSRSSAGWIICTSASAPERGRRHSTSSSGEGIATHSRPRAKTRSPGANMDVTRSPPAGRRARRAAVLQALPVEPLPYSRALRHRHESRDRRLRWLPPPNAHAKRWERSLRSLSAARHREQEDPSGLWPHANRSAARFSQQALHSRLGFGPTSATAIEQRCRCGRSAHDPADCNKTADSGSIPSRNGRLCLRQAAPGRQMRSRRPNRDNA